MKKVLLSIRERLELPSVLPERGAFVQQEIVDLIKKMIKFTAAEIEEFKMTDLPDGRTAWSVEAAKEVEYEFEDSFIEVMKKGVDQLDKAEAIHTSMFEMCKKIREL